MSLSLRQKLGLALAVLLLVQIAGVVVSLISVNVYHENTRLLAQDTLREVEALGEINAGMNAVMHETLAMLAFGAAEHGGHRQEAIDEVRVALTDLEAIVYSELSDEEAELAAFGRLRETAEALIVRSDRIVAESETAGGVRTSDGLLALEQQHEEFDLAFDSAHEIVDEERDLAVAQTQRNPLMLPLLLGLLAFVAGIALLTLIVGRVLLPLTSLRQATEAVAAGNLSQRLQIGGNDEIAALGHSFDTMVTTMAEQQQALKERADDLERSNLQQRSLLETVQALTVPAIPVGEGVLALPLLGDLDCRRIDTVTTTLLNRVAHDSAHTVILDVTGLAHIDGATVERLLAMAQCVQLLGARLILTGVSPQMALQVIGVQADLGQLLVRATLREGLELALDGGARHN
jgi:anti-anti-sigma regulatory factor/HAMP domain-containing protein